MRVVTEDNKAHELAISDTRSRSSTMIDKSIYTYIWQTSRNNQVKICLLASLVTFLSAVPLELQRRIVDSAVSSREVWLLLVLGIAYLAVILVQGGLKYVMNVFKGRVLEQVSLDLRKRILDRKFASPGAATDAAAGSLDSGTAISVLSAESEDVGEFASASLSTPLLQGGTIIWVMAYLFWVEPRIAVLAVLIYTPQALLAPKIQYTVNRLARRRTRIMRKLGREVVTYESLAEGEQSRLRNRAGLLVQLVFKIRMIIYRQKYILTFLGNFLDSFGVLVVLLVGGYLLIHDQTSVSTLVIFISGFQKISDPWAQLVNFYRSVSNARVTFRLVAETIDPVEVPARAVPGG